MENKQNHKILIIDDDPHIRKLLKDRLEANHHFVIEAGGGMEGLKLCSTSSPHLVLLDLQMPVMDGMAVLMQLRAAFPDLPVVIMTAYGTIDRAVEAIKLGAYDFLPKPCKPDHFLMVVKKAIDSRLLKDAYSFLKEEMNSHYKMMVGSNPQMRRIMELADAAAKSKSTILIEGESGTGKQLMAYYIHSQSDRKDRRFMQVNCTTLSEQLIESDLFGHEKGAFTGAIKTKKGRFELADQGTVFLDEIGDLPTSLQAKLLHVLEYGEFQRVGGVDSININIRIIAATNRDLLKEIAGENFRQDLYYRLNVIKIKLLPLRDRMDDLPSFACYFLSKHNCSMGKNVINFSPDAIKQLQEYHWPGNIRELENVIERAVVLAQGTTITPDHLSIPPSQNRPEDVHIGTPLEKAILTFKKQYISRTLEATRHNQTKAAKLLDIQRSYLNKLIKEMDIGDTSA